MAGDWWRASLWPDLSQGDVVGQLPAGTVTDPPKFLFKAPLKGAAVSGWAESLVPKPDADQMCHYLVRGRVLPSLILSHDCDLDKSKERHRVLITPLVPMSNLSTEERAKMLEQTPYNAMPLIAVPSLGDHYVDLRTTLFMPKKILSGASRLASMTDEARVRLRLQIITFFTRLDATSLLSP
jgi:hypothetical protein